MPKTFADYVTENKRLLGAHKTEFFIIFHRSLQDFMNLITGFDIIKFDDEIIKPDDDQSTSERVLLDYGQRGLDLVNKLLSIKPSVQEITKAIDKI